MVITVGCLLPTLVAFTSHWWWVGDLCCHFRMQYAVLLIPLVVVLAVLRWWTWLAVTGLVWCFSVVLVLPLFLPRPQSSAETETIRVTTANIFVHNRNSELLLDFVQDEQPDIVLLLEVDDRWMVELAGLFEVYPYRVDSIHDLDPPESGTFGCALLSKLPLSNQVIKRIGSQELPVALADVEFQGWTLSLCGVHPVPPKGQSGTALRDEYLGEVGRMLAARTKPTVLLGDLNITRWSPRYQQLRKTAGLENAADGFGFLPTWPDGLFPVQIPIDQILVSEDIEARAYRVGPSIGSDHLPVTVDLALPAADWSSNSQ